jgi:hypothetical protein
MKGEKGTRERGGEIKGGSRDCHTHLYYTALYYLVGLSQ